MTKIIDGAVTKATPILFDDDEVTPILFPLGEGEKLDWARKVFQTSRKTMETAAKQFRFFNQGKANATIFV